MPASRSPIATSAAKEWPKALGLPKRSTSMRESSAPASRRTPVGQRAEGLEGLGVLTREPFCLADQPRIRVETQILRLLLDPLAHRRPRRRARAARGLLGRRHDARRLDAA